MPCTGRFATAAQYATMFCLGTPLTADETLYVETMLDIAAADLHVALAASDQCGCALAPWATAYLAKIEVIDAGVIHNCRCMDPRITDEQRQMWLTWMNEQLGAIRKGELELCQGATSASYPARATAEVAWTDWAEAEIIYHTEQRTLP